MSLNVSNNVFAFRSTGNRWIAKLLTITDSGLTVPFDLTGFDKVYIVFWKPDGTQIPTDDQIRDGVDQGAFLESPSTPDNSNIVFFDEFTPSFLDLRGYWEYSPAAKIGEVIIKSPQRTGFWVS